MPADRLEVRLLPLLLERDPVAPLLFQRHAEDVLELPAEVGLRSRSARRPIDHRLRPVDVGEVGHEARAVEVRVGAGLKVGGGPLGLEPHHVPEVGAVAHHRSPHHLVVGAQPAADTAGHPGLEEDCDALVIPARRVPTRVGQIVVDDGEGIVVVGGHLAAEELAPGEVGAGGLVHGRQVRNLVVGEPEHPIDRGQGLVGEVERRHPDPDAIGGDRVGGACSSIGEVVDEDGRLLAGLPAIERLVELQGVPHRAADVRHQELGGLPKVEDVEVLGFDDADPLGAHRRREQTAERPDHQAPAGRSDPHASLLHVVN